MRRPLVFFCFLLLISSCAQIGTPSGGDFDRTPPKVVRYQPDSASTNFNARSIEITFNEYVQLQELSNQLLISPPLEFNPEVTVKKKTLVIELDKKEVLKPNTTYSISFGNAVKDIREANAVENFKYIFSTGSFIDSLMLNGSIQNAFDHKTEKNLLVLLYSNMDDSAIYKGLPDYFAKTNDAGAFQMNNIRQDKYRAVALKDENSNYKYDDGERFGFLSEPVEAGVSKDIFIYLYNEQPKKVFLKKYNQVQYGKFILIFSKGTDSLRISKLNKEELKGVKEFTEFSKTKDTITYWMDPIDKDSLILQVNNGSTILDTLRFKLIKKESTLKSSRVPFRFALVNSLNAEAFDLNRELQLIFSHPIEKVNDTTTVLLKEDTLKYSKYPLVYTKADALPEAVKITTQKKIDAKNSGRNMLLKESTTYNLMVPAGSFTDFYGLTNDSIKIKFRTKEEKFYGSVKLNLTTEAVNGNFIVQLLDEKETIVRQSNVSKSQTVFYDYLYPATYRLKVILDKNSNGKWDEGNYLQKQQPERVIFNTEPVNIRSNWDLELDWKIREPK